MNKGEARLVADGVKAPELGDVHLVFRSEAPRDIDAACRDIKMKRHARTSQVRPLGHRLEMVDRFRGFDLDGSFQLASFVSRREYEVGKNLHRTDFHGNRLIGADIHGDLVLALQARLQEPYDAIVFELLAYRPHEYRTHRWSALPKSQPPATVSIGCLVESDILSPRSKPAQH